MRILIIGRYLVNPIYNIRDYDHVCFVNCESRHPGSSDYKCLCSNSLFVERMQKRNHDRCIVYNPHNRPLKVRPRDVIIPKYYLDAIKFACPDYNESNVGGCSTGLMAIFYFLYSGRYDVDIAGFSHYSIMNGVVEPEEGMQDTIDGSIGRYSPQLEYQLAEFMSVNYSSKLVIHKSKFKGITNLKYFIDNCSAAVFMIGDSHLRIFKHMPIKKYLKIRSATTMFRVYRDGIDDLLKPTHERCIPLESKETPKHGDICFFSFGYVDVINNIVKHNTPVNTIVHRYVRHIKDHCDLKMIFPIIQVDLIQQPSDVSHKHTGTLQERIRIHDEMCRFLKLYCNEYTISMFEYTDEYKKDDGTFDTKKALSEDNAHIGHNSTNAVTCEGCEKCSGKNAKQIWNKFYNLEISMH